MNCRDVATAKTEHPFVPIKKQANADRKHRKYLLIALTLIVVLRVAAFFRISEGRLLLSLLKSGMLANRMGRDTVRENLNHTGGWGSKGARHCRGVAEPMRYTTDDETK